jgi:ribosome-associated protein YbcJ (S4-like RNA binding protein)
MANVEIETKKGPKVRRAKVVEYFSPCVHDNMVS